MTERVERLLEFLHSTRDGGLDEDVQLDRLLADLDDMLDICSLDSLARTVHNKPPRETPYMQECNMVLEKVDVCRLSTMMLISLPRFTYSKKEFLPAWDKLCQIAVAETRVREPETWKDLMHGLYEEGAAP